MAALQTRILGLGDLDASINTGCAFVGGCELLAEHLTEPGENAFNCLQNDDRGTSLIHCAVFSLIHFLQDLM